MSDTGNWKCFFGMHQWEQIDKTIKHYYDADVVVQKTVIYTNRCVHCGKLHKTEID